MFLIAADNYQVKKTVKKGSGVFAKKHIPAGTLIGDYVGRVVKDTEVDEIAKINQGCYAFEYFGNVSIVPQDIKAIGVHLINHSCSANCSVFEYQGHNIFFALRHIFPGEEITFDYEFDSSVGGGDHPCFCDSPFCRGTMYARAEKIRVKSKPKLSKIKKEKKIDYVICQAGEIIKPLLKYPKEIKDNRVYNIYANLKVSPVISKEKKLPTLKVMREIIRLTGRRLKFSELNLSILAVVDDHLIIER